MGEAREWCARSRPAALRRLIARGLSGGRPAGADACKRRSHRDRHQGLDLLRLQAAVRLDGDVVEELGAVSGGGGPASGVTPAAPGGGAGRARRSAEVSRAPAGVGSDGAAKCVLGGRDGGVAAGIEGRQILLLVGAGASRAARPAAPRARRAAEAPPPGLAPGRGPRGARRSKGSQTSIGSRPASTAASRSCGRRACGAPLAPDRGRDLHRLLPATLGEPVAGAVAGSDDQSGVAPDLVAVRVLGRNPVGSQHGVHAPKRRRTRWLRRPRRREPPARAPRAASSGSDGSAGITVRRVTGTSGGGPGSARRARRMRRGPPRRGRAQGLHDDDRLARPGPRPAAGSARRRARVVRERRAARTGNAGRGSSCPQPIAGARLVSARALAAVLARVLLRVSGQ